jgi:hypothetical protein
MVQSDIRGNALEETHREESENGFAVERISGEKTMDSTLIQAKTG